MAHDRTALMVRRADLTDLPQILELARRSLGWDGGPADAEFFRWKHLENPCGVSPMWVAEEVGRVVGFRSFLRWRFQHHNDEPIQAVRAVDTATDPEYQGRGIFTKLTLDALEELRAEGVRLIFNTPNERSRPGYLKMGWSVIGRIPVAVMPTSIRSLARLAGAHRPAERRSLESTFGEAARDVVQDDDLVARLLRTESHPGGLATQRTPAFMAWRYGFEPLHYRAVLAGPSGRDGLVVFRLRRRGHAVEAVVCEVLAPGIGARRAHALIRQIARSPGVDYLIRLQSSSIASRGPFVRVPGVGPILTCRTLDGTPVPEQREWRLTLGDVELF